MNNPAKFTDSIISEICTQLERYRDGRDVITVLDPFAGSGKIASIKDVVNDVHVIANDIETEWNEDKYDVDEWFHCDSEFLDLDGRKVDFIITSPTYGNRMADHHNAKDGSKRMTYTHCLGHVLTEGNTGVLQYGSKYQDKHVAIMHNVLNLVRDGGYVMINISNHIRKSVEVDVVGWWKSVLSDLPCLEFIDDISIATPRMRFGSNSDKRVDSEHLLVFRKKTVEK